MFPASDPMLPRSYASNMNRDGNRGMHPLVRLMPLSSWARWKVPGRCGRRLLTSARRAQGRLGAPPSFSSWSAGRSD